MQKNPDGTVIRKGQKSTNPNSKYKIRQRVFDLTEDQYVQAEIVANDLVSTLQLLVEDRIDENQILRPLLREGRENELNNLMGVLLIEIRKAFTNMRSL